MKVVTDKTASLIATSGRFGAMFSDAPEGVAAGIAKACGAFGVAWQLADDILDVASETVQSGKTPGTDLHEGVLTLPMLHALRMAGPGDARLVELLSSGKLTDPGAARRGARAAPRAPGDGAGPGRPEGLGRGGPAGDHGAAGRARASRVRGPVRLRGRAHRIGPAQARQIGLLPV